MDEIFKDDEFLARWLAGELTEEELHLFQQHPDFDYYQKIANTSLNIETPSLDKKTLLDKIKTDQRFEKKEQAKVRRLNRRSILGIAAAAAAILIFIGYFTFSKNNTVNILTAIGEQKSQQLPDGSIAFLNANSSITYNSDDFSHNRTLSIEGEVFFEVKKGNAFKVKTSNGKVEVLGTSFSVYSRAKTLMVSCKTGSVKVSDNTNSSKILQPGERIKTKNSILQNKEKINPNGISNWRDGQSTFDSESLSIVVKAIENQFGVTIKLKEEHQSQKFTGHFLHSDIETAMKMVFSPMGYDFEKIDKDNYLIN